MRQILLLGMLLIASMSYTQTVKKFSEQSSKQLSNRYGNSEIREDDIAIQLFDNKLKIFNYENYDSIDIKLKYNSTEIQDELIVDFYTISESNTLVLIAYTKDLKPFLVSLQSSDIVHMYALQNEENSRAILQNY